MDPAEERRPGAPLLRFFGLESPAKAAEVVRWTLPYLAVLCLAFAGLSYLVHLLMPLSPWVYVVASALAVLYFFLFLARIRQMASESHARSHPEGAERGEP